MLMLVSRPSNTGFIDPRADPQAVLDAIDAENEGDSRFGRNVTNTNTNITVKTALATHLWEKISDPRKLSSPAFVVNSYQSSHRFHIP